MWVSGSRAFGFIQNPHDYDFVKYEDEPIDEELLHTVAKHHKADIFIIKRNQELNEYNFLHIPSWDKRININSPLICKLPPNSFFIQNIMKVLNNLNNIKILYRIEILLEFIENDYIFNPTKEQKELINNLHDCKVDLNSYIKDVKKRLLELNSNLSTN